MGILNLFRSRKTPDLDGSVLAQLRKSGSDLSKPHTVEFFLYFPTQEVADKAGSSIREAGFNVEVSKAAQGDTWLCFATKNMVPDLGELQKIRQKFVALAESHNGEYDGWGTTVVK
jgi:regulator of RNase E activity RraB